MLDTDHVTADTRNEMQVLFRTCIVYIICPYLVFSSRIARSGIFIVLTECLLTDDWVRR